MFPPLDCYTHTRRTTYPTKRANVDYHLDTIALHCIFIPAKQGKALTKSTAIQVTGPGDNEPRSDEKSRISIHTVVDIPPLVKME